MQHLSLSSAGPATLLLAPWPCQVTDHPTSPQPIFIPLKPHWNHSPTVNTFGLCALSFHYAHREKPQPWMNPPSHPFQVCSGACQVQLENRSDPRVDFASCIWENDFPPTPLSTQTSSEWYRWPSHPNPPHLPAPAATSVLSSSSSSAVLEVNAHPLTWALDYILPTFAGTLSD